VGNVFINANRILSHSCAPATDIFFEEGAITPNFKDVASLDIRKRQGYLDDLTMHDACFALLRPSRRLP
jgi:hypothetical protein